MLLKYSMENYREYTVVKEVIPLKRDAPSSWDGRFPNWVKMVSLISLLIEDLMQENIAFAFWMALSFT